MQSSSFVSAMPSLENAMRLFKENTGHDLRRGQKNAAEYVLAKKSTVVVEAPTGYGKSIMLMAMFIAAAEKYGVNRLLLVVPNNTQLEQYASEFADTANKFGVNVGRPKIVTGDGATHKSHRENRTSVFITTIHKAVSDAGFFDDMMSTGCWALGADEHHHYSSDVNKSWPKAIAAISQHCAAIFAASAAKVRTDGAPSYFGLPDIVITVGDALKEEAIRKFVVNQEHYDVDVMVDGEESPLKLKTDQLLDSNMDVKDFNKFETKKQLRYLTKYVGDLISRSLIRLDEKLLLHPGQHQMLVFCMTCKHAESVTKLINGLRPGYADWAGSGPNGRSDDENKDVVKRYKQNELPVFVQVDIAGEGFDNPRSSVALFINLLGGSVKSMQHLGRVLRRNYGIKNFADDIADIFVSSDSELVEFFANFAELQISSDEDGDDDGEGSGGGGDPRILTIPNLTIVKAAHDRSSVRYPRGMSEEEAKETAVRAAEIATKNGGPKATAEQIEALMNILRAEGQKEVSMSVDEEMAVVRKQIFSAVNVYIGNVIRKKYGSGSYDKTLFKDHVTRINGWWKRLFGGHSDMTLDDLKKKYAWIKSLNDDLKANNKIPQELLV